MGGGKAVRLPLANRVDVGAFDRLGFQHEEVEDGAGPSDIRHVAVAARPHHGRTELRLEVGTWLRGT